MSSRTCSTTLPRARTYNAPSPSTRDKAPIESVRSSLCVIGLPPRFPSNQGNHHQPRAPEERSQGSGWNLTSTTGDEGLYAPNTRMGIVLSKHEGGAVMSRKKVLVLGGNFGGLTAALAVARELRGDVDVRVVSASDHFLFNPSLIWLPFGKRRAAAEIADEKGYVKVRDTYQTLAYDDVYAVGIAAAVDVPWQTPTPVGIPKTGFPTERMAHVAARNIAAQIRGEPPVSHEAFADMPAVCVMDAGNNGVIILADKMLPPRKHGVLIPGPQAHAMKLGFEKYFLWKARHGYVQL